MKITDELLQKYAKVIVRTGVNVQPGQVVMLTVAVDQAKFGMMVMEECYQAGAKKVNINWSCDQETRMNMLYAKEETLSKVLPWEEAKLQQMVDDLPCRIFIESDDPDALAGIDPQKLSAVMQARGKVNKKYRNQIEDKHQWVIAAIPSAAWAKKCFPELSEEDAIQKLWDAILQTVRVNEENDPVAEWDAHNKFLSEKAAWLNEQKFEKIAYHSSNGTEFEVTLIPGAKWEGAGTINPLNQAYYIPNMPTEEVFTSPMAGKCEGTLVATKPLSWNSQLIEDFSITFKDGRAVSVQAKKGQELLEKMIKMDETACMLGELALVPKESPVNQCGFLFYNTLFDENACCHCALGMGFKEVLPGGSDMTMEEAQKMGLNDSVIHVDFMIGSDDLHIEGIRPDGSREDIFLNGTWA